MSFPAFMGVISRVSGRGSGVSPDHTLGWRRLWNLDRPRLNLWLRHLQEDRNYHSWTSEDHENAISVFLHGQVLIAKDSEFSPQTNVEQIPHSDVAERIARLYQRHSTQAFALLEGNFSLVLWDRAARTVLLVVDKFGCDDIYFRSHADSLEFTSDPALLRHSPVPLKLNAIATAFFLAQEGFVPAPFTLFDGIESIGRATLLRIHVDAPEFLVEKETYWSLPATATTISAADAVNQFHSLLAGATIARCRDRNGILLSGGIDSSLLANLIVRHKRGEWIAVTGAISGNAESESEVRRAAALASELDIPHEPIYINPQDQSLPDEWMKCTASWSGGTRVTLPLFYRLAKRLLEVFGPHWTAFSGQIADTLADNNYTLSSPGYFVRRLFFSSWFFRCLRFARWMSPHVDSRMGKLLVKFVKILAGNRISAMLASLLDGLSSPSRFYEGRIFGYGEMPGRSRVGFPVLSDAGFEQIADWYSRNYVAPVIERLTPESFYFGLISLSMDMCMLHLDTRLALHAMRICGGDLQFPYLDSRIVKFFAGLPYLLRAFYRQPKYVIHAQFQKHGYTRPGFTQSAPLARSPSSEELLLKGSLGIYFRGLLRGGNVFERTPELCSLIDQAYVEGQILAFQSDLSGVNYKFIARLAALEQWSHMCEEPSVARAAAIA